ncbi:hypothetical protein FD754_019602 [Muntiacus muntjak]|uniref:AarF domain-containing protein kinase 1 n=1 Tax=Muntiacus muntjak TaxID=9888 RepID=A0A5N3V0L5_MUNMU|nr:hypothetical protein FD754_019602 [Muntiacus muntjak]
MTSKTSLQRGAWPNLAARGEGLSSQLFFQKNLLLGAPSGVTGGFPRKWYSARGVWDPPSHLVEYSYLDRLADTIRVRKTFSFGRTGMAFLRGNVSICESLGGTRGTSVRRLVSRVRLFATPWTVVHQAPLSIHDLFLSFDDTPLGAASLAQVHKAVLRDGRTVAVKVQHPKVQAQSSKDILLMEVLVLAVKQLFPEFEFMWLVDEAKKNLPLELDFLNEGRNAEKVAQMLKHFDFLKVPRIYWELSTKRVLLMEFVDGGQVNDRHYMERNKIDVNEISRHLGRMYSEMIFVNGFVHCDPHPGNVLVRKRLDTGKVEIVLLDHGLYQALTEEFRLDYCRLWQSLIWTDMQSVRKYSQRLGAGDLYPLFACMLTARSWDAVNRGIGQTAVTATEDSEIRNHAANYLPQISQLLNRVPRQMLLIFKTNDLLRGIEAALGTRASASSFLNMSRCCIRALAAHKKQKTHSLFRRARISLREAFSLWKINLHELVLHVKGLRLTGWVWALLCWLLPAPH